MNSGGASVQKSRPPIEFISTNPSVTSLANPAILKRDDRRRLQTVIDRGFKDAVATGVDAASAKAAVIAPGMIMAGTRWEHGVRERDPALENFLFRVRDVLTDRDLGPDGRAAIDCVYTALETPGRSESHDSRRLPVCDVYLPEAFGQARRHSPPIARIIDAFEAIEPRLVWAPRGAGGPCASANWPEGHANATIVGPGGLERRSGVHVGVSLLAPHVRYPDHNHSPEEVYLVLSPGRFQHGESGWFEPGIGGFLYNAPNLRHAMASEATPLFAIWLLWTGRPR